MEEWRVTYKPSGEKDGEPCSSSRETFLDKQFSKIRRIERKDELERYLSEETVSTSLVTHGSLQWWRVSKYSNFILKVQIFYHILD